MNKLVVIRLNHQPYDGSYQTITEIGNEGAVASLEIRGKLPPLPAGMTRKIQALRTTYEKLEPNNRLKVKKIDVNSLKSSSSIQLIKNNQERDRLEHCFQDLLEELKGELNGWINSIGFHNTNLKLWSELTLNDNIQIIIHTDNGAICALPWNFWKFLEDHPNSEISFSLTNESYSSVSRQSGRLEGLKILAVMGNDEGLDLSQDSEIFKRIESYSHDIFIQPLWYPSLQQLNKTLEQGPWDILFFSGHSETLNDIGLLYLNDGEPVRISELKNSLNKAISCGLKLAIFNSCDGIGIARDLQDLQIPQIIAMRNPIPDKVAHAFLDAYVEGIQILDSDAPLYQAERHARNKLRERFPNSEWLPIIFQNHKVVSPVRGILGKARTEHYDNSPTCEEIRNRVKLTLESSPIKCKVINPVGQNKVGQIQHIGCLWKSRILPVKSYGEIGLIFPGQDAYVVARRGSLCFVLPEGIAELFFENQEKEHWKTIMSDLSELLNIHPDPFEKSVVSHSSLSATVKSDPHDDLKQKLEITLEGYPSPCRVTHAIKQGSLGRIQYSGGFWKAQLFPLQSISQIDPILPTHPAYVVARKGNICFVLPESLACSRNSRKEFSSIVKQELLGIRDPRKSSPRKPRVGLITSLLLIILIFFMGPFLLRSSSFSSGNDTTYHQNMKSYL